MSLIVTELPGAASRDSLTIASPQNLAAGTVLGRRYTGGSPAAVAVAFGNNFGNGVMGAITVGSYARQGVYRLEFWGTPNAFSIRDPEDRNNPYQGIAGQAFNGGGLSFTLAVGATPWRASDGFLITVSGGSYKYHAHDNCSALGEQIPEGVLAQAANASGGDTAASVLSRSAVVNFDDLVWHANFQTLPQKLAAIKMLKDRTGIEVTRAS